MAEDATAMSVKDRIAQLKLNQVGRVPETPPPAYEQVTNGTTWTKRPAPPPRPNVPPRPSVHPRAQSTSVPTAQHHIPFANGGIANQPEAKRPTANANGMDGITRPALPPRTSTLGNQGPSLPSRKPSEPSPALPPRRPSETPSQPDYRLSRRGSNESISSVATARSSVSGISNATSLTSQGDRSVKAPAYDPSSLPPLPPKRTEEQKQAYYGTKSSSGRRPLKSTFSSPNIAGKQNSTTPPPPKRPSVQMQPSLPHHPESIREEEQQPRQIEPPPPPRRPAEPPRPKRSALEMGFGTKANGAPPPLPSLRPGSVPPVNGAPPPIPTSSRPDLAALRASKPKTNGATAPAASSAPATSCLHCRDFSAADAHAARFPRQSLPSFDVGWLANQLTAPFPSTTDKARAIFTWLHHNIYYNTKDFFARTVKPSTPQSTLETGLAVCEGYAGLFAALGMKAGLEAYVVSGHGKGYGYSKLKAGEPLPAYNAGHAWNAVKLDDSLGCGPGQWKLIDACWGAGHLGAGNLYEQKFSPWRFTQSNDDFGLDHYPGDVTKQFRNDGRQVTWEEYITGNKNGCGAQFFSGYTSGEGIHEPSFRPAFSPIVLAQQGPTVRFSFQKVCPHWTPEKNGKGAHYLYTLAIDAQEGDNEKNHRPFETNGEVWWCDVPVRDLGRAGQEVKVLAVTEYKGRDGRGVTIGEYREGMGRTMLMWAFVAKWVIA